MAKVTGGGWPPKARANGATSVTLRLTSATFRDIKRVKNTREISGSRTRR